MIEEALYLVKNPLVYQVATHLSLNGAYAELMSYNGSSFPYYSAYSFDFLGPYEKVVVPFHAGFSTSQNIAMELQIANPTAIPNVYNGYQGTGYTANQDGRPGYNFTVTQFPLQVAPTRENIPDSGLWVSMTTLVPVILDTEITFSIRAEFELQRYDHSGCTVVGSTHCVALPREPVAPIVSGLQTVRGEIRSPKILTSYGTPLGEPLVIDGVRYTFYLLDGKLKYIKCEDLVSLGRNVNQSSGNTIAMIPENAKSQYNPNDQSFSNSGVGSVPGFEPTSQANVTVLTLPPEFSQASPSQDDQQNEDTSCPPLAGGRGVDGSGTECETQSVEWEIECDENGEPIFEQSQTNCMTDRVILTAFHCEWSYRTTIKVDLNSPWIDVPYGMGNQTRKQYDCYCMASVSITDACQQMLDQFNPAADQPICKRDSTGPVLETLGHASFQIDTNRTIYGYDFDR